jgi:iron complex transport system ATP-binding protein
VDVARRRAADGTAIVAVLHDLNLAVRFADRIVVLHDGSIAADGAPRDVISSDLVRRVFEIDVVVERLADGSPYVLPQMMWPVGQ